MREGPQASYACTGCKYVSDRSYDVRIENAGTGNEPIAYIFREKRFYCQKSIPVREIGDTANVTPEWCEFLK